MVSVLGDKSENILVGEVDIVKELLAQIFGKINGMNILVDTIDSQV